MSSSLAYGTAAVCSSCSSLIPLSAEPLICSLCSKPCCWKCSREPADRVSLFRAPAVICANCSTSGLQTAATMDHQQQQQQQLQRCRVHPDRFLNLFCLTCEVQICCDCFIQTPEHKRHTIDSVEEVYRQKLLETVEKFREIPKKLKLVDWDAVRQVDENLKIIQEMEQRILGDIRQLFQQRTTIMLNKTAEKKAVLQKTKDFVDRTEMQHRQTMESIQGLNTNDFLRLQAALNERCDSILADVGQLQVEPVRWDDIECDLLPSCKLQPIVLNVPAVDGNKEKHVQIQLIDDCGIVWNTTFFIGGQSLALEMKPNRQLDEFHFKTIVEMSHSSRIKVSGKSFSFKGNLAKNELISLPKLTTGGYLTDTRDLVMRIGIRPENILEESDLLKALLVDQRKLNAQLKVENAALKDQNFILRGDLLRLGSDAQQERETHESQITALTKRLKMFQHNSYAQAVQQATRPQTPISPISQSEDEKEKLCTDMQKLRSKLDEMKSSMKSMNPFAIGSFEIYRWSKDSKFYSPQVTSHVGVSVYIIIVPNFACDNSSDVNAYVCWAKGPKMRCQIFIEVVNEFEDECVREDRVFDFSKGTSFTWKTVISHYNLFRSDGFLSDDHLKIKFGVRPAVE